MTEEHPFYVDSQGWTAARKLGQGDILLAAEGTLAVVSNHREAHPQGVKVYNLEVADAHTYFVHAENASAAAAVWVHNAEYPDVMFRRWRRGDAIDKLMPDGSAPSWKVVQSRYWKNRFQAAKNTGEFSAPQLRQMRRGKAPMDFNLRTGAWEPRELHHVWPQRYGGSNGPLNLRELTPDWHGEVDPSRHVPGIVPTRGIQ